MAFPDSQLDDDIVKFLNDNVIINDVEWDGKVLEINDSDLRNDLKLWGGRSPKKKLNFGLLTPLVGPSTTK